MSSLDDGLGVAVDGLRKKYVGYIRVSDTRGREDSLISDKAQKADIEAYATLLHGEVTEWRIDLDRTGTNTDRPGFLDAIDLVESGAVQGLIVARLNRFARNAADATAIARRIEKAGGEFASAHERLDNGPYGKFTRTLFFAMGELEVDIIREQWLSAQSTALAEGRTTTPWAPAGFELVALEGPVRDGQKRKAPKRWLVPHPVFGPLITEAFERRAYGQTVSAVASFLNHHNVPNSRGRTGGWTRAETSRMLARRTYIGELRHGASVAHHAHLAIVDAEVFKRVQSMRVVREPTTPRNASGYLLSGIARCAGCGHALKGHRASAAMVRNGSRDDYYYYRCAKQHVGGECQVVANAAGDQLDAYAVTRMFEIVEDLQADSDGCNTELGEAMAVLRGRQDELAAYVELESALGEHYLTGFRAREAAVREANDTVVAIRAKAGTNDLPPVAVLRTEWEKWSTEDKRKLFAQVAPCVMVRKSPRLTPIEKRALVIPLDRLHEVGLPSRGNGRDAPVLRSFVWTD